MQFTARCFGPGLPGAGSVLPVTLDDGALTVELPGGQRRSVPPGALGLRRAGFNGASWELSWSDAGGAWALIVDDPRVQQALAAQPPAALAAAVAAIGREQRRGRMRRGLGLSAIALWLALPLLALLMLVVLARPLAGWAVQFVPVEREQALGEWFFKAQRARIELLENTAAAEAVRVIGERLTQGSHYDYRWYVADDPSINAYAIPGGIVVVHSGLIEAADSAEEVAGVLAHEVQHIEQRHSLRALAHEAGLSLALLLVFGDAAGAADVARRLSALSFSREQEREADRLGLVALQRAGIDPSGMLRIFAKLAAESAESAVAPPQWLSTHPATGERIEALRKALPETCRGCEPLPFDWAQVRASVAGG